MPLNYYHRIFQKRAIAGLFLLACVALASCEKVVDIDLNSAEKKYVIEAVLTDQAGTAKVTITQTKNFDEDNNFPPVKGAVVTITENGGATTPLVETPSGNYIAAALKGTSGKSYTLSVTVGGQTFTAVSTMPARVNLDTIFITDELIFTETRKIVNAVIKDPPGLGNSYRFVQYVNGRMEYQIMIRNDEYSDDRTIVNKLFYFPEDDEEKRIIKTGDEVAVDLQCIDVSIYKYWFSFDRSSIGGSGQATPSNPVSNMRGGALGYFSAHTLQGKKLIVP